MEKKVLIDSFGTSIRMKLTEDKTGAWIAEGEYGKCDVPTENRRIYPRNIWEREIKKIQQSISEGKVQGHLDHPADGKTSLNKVSHVMKKLWMEDDGTIMGVSKICDNEHGRQLKSILDAGGAVGVSSRGLGSTEANADGYDVVQDDYSYIVHDFVADPAVKTSYPKFTEESVKRDIKKVVEIVNAPNLESKTESKDGAVQNENKETSDKGEIEMKQEEITKLLKESEEKLVEKFSKELITKLSEEKEKIRTEVRNELLSDPATAGARTALESVKQTLRPYILPEDVEKTMSEKEKEISSLKESIAKLTTEKAELSEAVEKISSVAKNLGLQISYERMVNESVYGKEIRSAVGSVLKYADEKLLKEAIEKAENDHKMKLVEDARKAKLVEEEAKKVQVQTEEKELKIKKLEDALTEAIDMSKNLAARLYIEQKVKNNPNGAKIRELCEGVNDQKKIDGIISRFVIEEKTPQRYNSVRERIAKAKATPNLVEEQLKDTGLKLEESADPKSTTEVVPVGVDAEMANLFDVNSASDLAGVTH